METEVERMEAVRTRIDRGGLIRIPQRFMRSVGLREGLEVILWTEVRKLVLVPASPRRRLRLAASIVDELVEYEERFEPEVT